MTDIPQYPTFARIESLNNGRSSDKNITLKRALASVCFGVSRTLRSVSASSPSLRRSSASRSLTFPRHDQLTSAGARELQAVCDKLAPIKTGEAVITPGFALLAKYVIHAADPVYRDGKGGEEAELRAAYTNSLKLDIDVSLVVFDKAAFMVSAELIGDVQSYIDEH